MGDKDLAKELKDLVNQFESSKHELKDLLDGIDETNFNKHPAPSGWSVAECVDHLIITGKDYTRQIENGLKKAERKKLLFKGRYKFSWIGKSFIKNIEPPVRRRFKVPARWTPEKNLPLQKIKDEYLALQDRYIELLNRSGGLDIMKVKLPSPATSLLRFSIYEMFHVNAAHQRRHLWQAKNVKKAISV
ncbi:MAG TPA: DinB family protein [Ignavibacteria bacterium]|nr:DinB family protein [Ignavibacteria bacterium]